MGTDLQRRVLSGWGLTAPSASLFAEVRSSELAAHLAEHRSAMANASGGASRNVQDRNVRGLIVRGLGRSYGDASQNAGGVVLRLAGASDEAIVDTERGVVTVGAGVSLDDLMKILVPRGWFVPVTPGTRFVTVGGAIASDIHGKNHHVEGSFGNHLERMSVMVASGDVIECSPSVQSELFWATVGGMGLTGVVLDATFRLIPIETSRCIVDTIRCRDFDELIGEMSIGDDDVRYSVSWIDLLATGRDFGRGVLWRGDHAKVADLTGRDAADPLAYEPRRLGGVPPVVPARGVVNSFTSRVFNELWLRKEPRRRHGTIKSIPSYFHPLDSVSSWNRLYGRSGFVQYQFVVPFGAEDRFRTIVERIVASRLASPLVVLKRFGAANPAPLSFPMPGWTLTVDMPAAGDGLAELVHSLDTTVLEAGGRHYLAKDACTTAAVVHAGYPRLDEWRRIRQHWDPDHVFASDLARRLELV